MDQKVFLIIHSIGEAGDWNRRPNKNSCLKANAETRVTELSSEGDGLLILTVLHAGFEKRQNV